MKRILVTGGPVHAHLDAVKLITNRFKGGLMCQLAEALLAPDVEVTYLCAPSVGAQRPHERERLTVLSHTGFEDYRRQVLALAPTMDAVVLGAAVANLIPANPIKGKFPSHNYKVGDIIPIDFTIAPRIIDEVKRVAPKTHLFGFKLLSGVPHEELIDAAYDIVLESKATAVFANDAERLERKYAVTKERGVHEMSYLSVADWILKILGDEYYSTAFVRRNPLSRYMTRKMRGLIAEYVDRFTTTKQGLIFGTIAVRYKEGFVTTGRGKRELDSLVYVAGVDHSAGIVYTANDAKASLNAPLLARLFENPQVKTILHFHEKVSGIPTYAYAPPGTVRDANRENIRSFNIEGHGCMLLFDKKGVRL